MSEIPVTTAFLRTLRAEWTKARTVRGVFWIAVAMVLVTPGLAVFVGATESLQPDDTILGGSLTGAVIGQVLAAALGALVISDEYGDGLIRSTFLADPGRVRVLAAKAVVVAVPVYVLSLLSGYGAFLVGDAFLSGAGFEAGSLMPELLGVALCFAGAGLIGLTLGTALRHTAGAISAATALILLPSLVGPLFGDLQSWVSGASPTAPLRKLAQSSDATAETMGSLPAWPSVAILAAYTFAALGFAALLLRRRDV
ncbi:ABC transporter permease subunit [Actinocorallia sp. API 0066]|uniref:ABC transporter permease subunit n=1 Tax=Actinocorallia sp. API 0066 TaxID=2896846 RepID=UPI001E28B1AF|nr:ABC transporter permease subunit [Actinocorallia sp. API 0066]MCD0449425.1 ABC transporter permease subunit [Actinocorallia sp. API 0066]